MARFEMILLAAGSGTRMGALTTDRPKAMVEVDGKPILLANVEQIGAGFPAAAITVVTGYMASGIAAFVAAAGLPVRLVFNPDFATRGPLRSVQVALEAIGPVEMLAIGNGDTIFPPNALALLAASAGDAVLLCSEPVEGEDDDVQVQVEAVDGLIVAAAKRIAPVGTLPVSAGLLLARGDGTIALLRAVVADLLDEEARAGRQYAWHSLVRPLVERGARVTARVVPRESWWEFDSADCIARYDAALALRRSAP